MEKEIKNVNLSFCCQENWNGFTSIDESSRFCGTCKHKVVDFTQSNESEFNQLIGSGQKICGRFKRSQMSNSFLKIAAASVVAVASASSISCTENENVVPQTPQVESCETEPQYVLMGVVALPDSLVSNSMLGSPHLPVIVGDAPMGEEPLHYNPAIPAKGFYKK